MSIITQGQDGTAVILLQGILQKLGHRIKSDGKFGPATEEAVRSFQLDGGVKVDGKVGEETARKLVEKLFYLEEDGANVSSV